jgi:hypothetical protein
MDAGNTLAYFVDTRHDALCVTATPDPQVFHFASIGSILPSPGDYAAILQRLGKLPKGEVHCEEIGPRACFNEKGEEFVRYITVVTISP